jgi:NADH-quinone oxidoreductase subunit N
MALPVVAQNFSASDPIALAGLALSLVGLGFKVGVVPFHMWTPDVYEGAPTAVTAFMAVGAKLGAFAALLRLLLGNMPAEAAAVWVPAVAILAALTMILGNVVALAQTNIKRLLAYSSIAHGGYIMMAVAAGPASGQGVSAALYYMLAYLFTSMGAFAIVVMVERPNNQGLLVDDYKGLAKNNLGYALLLTYFMLSLTGMPLTGGFLGKFFVFKAAIDAGLIWLAVVGALTSVVSAYYYLRVVFYMFMVEGEGTLESHAPLAWTVGIAAVATIVLGLFPAPWLDMATKAIVQTLPLMIAGG